MPNMQTRSMTRRAEAVAARPRLADLIDSCRALARSHLARSSGPAGPSTAPSLAPEGALVWSALTPVTLAASTVAADEFHEEMAEEAYLEMMAEQRKRSAKARFRMS
jgi:hypothetical protein